MALPARPPERLRSLSAFFPVRDEEDTVVPVAEAILASVSTVADWTEVIIVDDGSRDRTAERADALARTHGAVRVVRMTPVSGTEPPSVRASRRRAASGSSSPTGTASSIRRRSPT
jgi:cellulose synthase/poly-beta-1,6-N-acetylglucosamine synthase-like glycosyltransferase